MKKSGIKRDMKFLFCWVTICTIIMMCLIITFEYIRLDLRVFKDEVERNNVTKAEYLIHKHRYSDGSVYY